MNVMGTATNPVTFTSEDETEKWGGLVINGYAPISIIGLDNEVQQRSQRL